MSDLDVLTNTITRAFEHDPVWSRALAIPGQPGAGGGTVRRAEFWRLWIEGALRYPSTWLTPRGEAVSVWIPPGGTEMSPEQDERFEQLAAERLGPAGAAYLFDTVSRFDMAHPRDRGEHYYLSLLGTHPDHRGHGIGMDLLRANLESIDAERLPAYLESTNPANDRRYESVGFEPVGAFSLPDRGPIVTTMWRSART